LEPKGAMDVELGRQFFFRKFTLNIKELGRHSLYIKFPLHIKELRDFSRFMKLQIIKLELSNSE
jgi:hypothetical protein